MDGTSTKPDVFRNDLTSLINRYSIEGRSNTPDFILAGFLESCLAAWDATTIARDRLMGRQVGVGARLFELSHTRVEDMPIDGLSSLLNNGVLSDETIASLQRRAMEA